MPVKAISDPFMAPMNAPKASPDQNRQKNRHIECPFKHSFGVQLAIHKFRLGKGHHDHRRCPDKRAGTQVNAARDNNLCDTQRNDPDDGHLQDHDLDPRHVQDGAVAVRVEVEQHALTLHVREQLPEGFKNQDDDDQRQKDVELVWPGFFGLVVLEPANTFGGIRHVCPLGRRGVAHCGLRGDVWPPRTR